MASPSETTSRIVEYFARGGLVQTGDEAFQMVWVFIAALGFARDRPTQARMLLEQIHKDIPDLAKFPSDEFDAFLRAHEILPLSGE